MAEWQLQDAKARFSRLVKQAIAEGPQKVTVHGEPAVVVMSCTDYRRLTEERPGLVEFLRASPLAGIDLDLERDRSPGRSIPL